MTYSRDMQAAARRHLQAADILVVDKHRCDVAGYLYGIAAECAVKAIMLEVRLKPLPLKQRKDDPFYAHFPHLKTLLRDLQVGRRGAVLSIYIKDDSFMHHWDTTMRYSKGSEIDMRWVDDWKRQARDVVGSIGT